MSVSSPVRTVDAALFDVLDRTHPTFAADVDELPVGLVEQALLERHRRTVPDQDVALHLADPEPTLAGTPLGRLAGEDLDRSPRTGVDLVRDHVVEFLIEDGPDEDLGVDLLTSDARMHDLLAARIETVLFERRTELLLFFAGEGGPVDATAFERTDLAAEHLQNVTDRHPRGQRAG